MKTGAWGTDASVLQTLADQGNELPARILDWRQLQKLKSTYADALRARSIPHGARTQATHNASPRLAGCHRTTRICRTFRSAPTKAAASATRSSPSRSYAGLGRLLADRAVKLLAHVAAIPALQESFARGEDIHARTASEVFGIPMAGMDPKTRRRAKAINFGIIYGISSFAWGDSSASRLVRHVPTSMRISRVIQLSARIWSVLKEEARINGYDDAVRPSLLGAGDRATRIPRVAVTPSARRSMHHCRAAASTSSSAQIGAAAEGVAGGGLKVRDCCCRCTRDEPLLEAPDDEVSALTSLARRVMESAATLSVPLVVETGAGRTWADAH